MNLLGVSRVEVPLAIGLPSSDKRRAAARRSEDPWMILRSGPTMDPRVSATLRPRMTIQNALLTIKYMDK